MAYKEVSRVEITEVIRQWQAGRGIREITRSTGLARNTIRKYIQTTHNRVGHADSFFHHFRDTAHHWRPKIRQHSLSPAGEPSTPEAHFL